MIGMATSVGWAQNSLTTKITQETISSKTYVFANGNPIKVTAGTDKQTIITLVDESEESVTIEDGSNLLLFGGSKDNSVESSSITIESGTFFDVYGGGYGTKSESSANVKNATLIIKGGTFLNIFGGGHTYAKVTEKVSITINDQIKFSNASNSWICPGGREDGKTSLKYPAFDNALNSVKEAELTINGGTYVYIGISGATGTGGYIDKVKATINDATINGGIYGNASNGRSNDVSAVLTNCTFAENSEIASINRGHAIAVNFSFIGCHFPTKGSVIANLGGATNWKKNYTSSEAVVVKPGTITYSFDSTCDDNILEMGLSDGLEDAIINVTGAKVKVASFSNGVDAASAAFTINSDATWTFNNGIEMTSDASLTENGKLIVKGTYTVSTAAQLEEAIKQKTVTEILLNKGEYTLTNLLELNKPITLSSVDPSNKATIKGYIAIKSDGATIKDINLSYIRKSSLFSDKVGISVFANKATITGNTFTTTGDGTNGIVFYPQGSSAVAQEYTVSGNTFNLAGANSTGIIVRENFKSRTQIPDAGTTATLSNGSELDKQIITSESKNTFSNMTGGYYIRVTGNYSVLDATGTGSDALTQKYIYSYVNEANVADAIVSSQMGATVKTSAASTALATKLNALTSKPALTSGVTILCSDNKTVYTDLASALASTTSNAEYISYTAGDTSSYKVETAKKSDPTIADGDKPTATTIEVGQKLSSSLLSGGAAKVKGEAVSGVFSWKAPETTVSAEGPTDYDVVFTPTDQTLYNTVETKASVKAIQYYTVTAGICQNGKVEITGAKASNKYLKDTTLTVKAIPAEHYEFVAWTEGANTYTVTKDASLVATFKAITHKVTFGENITVLNAGAAITTDADVAEGSVLTVTAAKDGNKLTALTYNNGKNVINNQITVDKAIAIKANFEALLPDTRLVKVDYTDAAFKNGKVQLYDEAGNIIESGSAVPVGKTVSIVAVLDYGYQVKTSELSVTGATLSGNKFAVEASTDPITVKQVFEEKNFTVTLPVEATDHATVSLTGSSDLTTVPYNTVLTVSSAGAATGYKLIAIIVNGKQVAEKETFTVTADTKVNAVVQELPVIQFTDTKQSCTYNKKEQSFTVRTIPAGISGITLSYGDLGEGAKPTEAGIYKVYATFTATDNFAGLSKKEIGTLEIKKAQWTAAAIPVYSNVKDNESSALDNEYYWSDSNTSAQFREATLKLSTELNKNYEKPKFIIPAKNEGLTAVTLTFTSEAPQERSMALRSGSETESVTLNGEGGSISVYNGPVKVTDGVYKDQTLTLKATPNAGYSSILTWEGDGITDYQDGTATIVLGKVQEVKATFALKAPAPIEGKSLSRTYNGVIYGNENESLNLQSVITSKVSGWSLDIQSEGRSVDPIDAGTYDIVASRSEDEAYAATSTTIGTLNIAKATPVLTEVKGSEIIEGQTLRESVLSGTSDVQGTFSWKNPDTQMNTTGNVKAVAVFESDNSNYGDKEVEATLKVTEKSKDVTTRTLTLTVNNPENGEAVVMTLNGTEVTGSQAVKEGDVLIVTFKANTKCTATATINSKSYTSGTSWTVPASGDVNVVVTYTKNVAPSDPGTNPGDDGDDDSDVISVTGVTLNATTKTLAVNATFTLKATVKPANADNKKVRWSSSDPTIATVDKDGNVKALKVGKCKITVTTDDGDYEATCEVTVSVATGIEELLTDNRVYSLNGLIIVEPSTMVEVTICDANGKLLFHNLQANKIQVTATAGYYLVHLKANDKETTVRLIVK